ncbi:hypothetical protein UA32_11770 [Photobacterium angustum]|uniref:Uncharacterized protein n=1 Tax=Photobacterium angustum TaxID=661 RepID=A0ABX5H230_PHOAN|nr:hypothetical protein [Photobacterium angustum]KJG37639.1 hypothetical protein UA32_11770 [Photobacterium angustum]PSX07095.1 hypothetical protein C0W27_16120 [Photobacterium angustum]
MKNLFILEQGQIHPHFQHLKAAFPYEGALLTAMSTCDNQVNVCLSYPSNDLIHVFNYADVFTSCYSNKVTGALFILLKFKLYGQDVLTYELPFNATVLPDQEFSIIKGNLFTFVLTCHKSGVVKALRVISLPKCVYAEFKSSAVNQRKMVSYDIDCANVVDESIWKQLKFVKAGL